MLCRTRATYPGVSPRKVRAHGGTVKQVFGTWDFKWPQNSNIRVAFQRPAPISDKAGSPVGKTYPQLVSDDGAFRELVERTTKHAETWMAPSNGSAPKIHFAWQKEPDHWWPAPSNSGVACSPKVGPVPYDVLVSFAPFPIHFDSPEMQTTEKFELSSSELGTYARRVDSGVPTVYLGQPEYFSRNNPGKDYFASEQFIHCIVHEFGHVLGLAHEHQNPRIKHIPWKDVQDIVRIFHEATGLTADQGFVESLITRPWPHTTEGHVIKFSDWRDNKFKDNNFDSIMTDPMCPCYLAGSSCADPKQALNELFQRQQAPTQSDLQFLKAMYP